jgi:hypothetical protein
MAVFNQHSCKRSNGTHEQKQNKEKSHGTIHMSQVHKICYKFLFLFSFGISVIAAPLVNKEDNVVPLDVHPFFRKAKHCLAVGI